jgi:hypothetical protein
MLRPAVLAAIALAAAGCSTPPCQSLGEKLCMCQPNMTADTCKTQVQDQLNSQGVDTPGFTGMLDRLSAGQPATFEDYCSATLDACQAAFDLSKAADFCQFLVTETGKNACGLSPQSPPAPAP